MRRVSERNRYFIFGGGIYIKTIVNWKTFLILLVACGVTSVLVIPYQAGLNPALSELGAMLYLGAFLQGTIIFSIVTFLGLILARKTGFSLPILEDNKKLETLKSIAGPSILWGLIGGILITLLAFLFGNISLELFAVELAVPMWARFLAIFYGGIAEEVLLRLFIMSFFV